LLMANRRMIDATFWQSETMARLPVEQRLLFIGLFSNADDQGRLRGHPALVRSMVFPYDDVEVGQIEAGLQALEREGCIHRYTAGGGQCLQIVNWWKYQKLQWASPSRIPAPEGWRDRVRYREGGKIRQQNWGDEAPARPPAEPPTPDTLHDLGPTGNPLPDASPDALPEPLPEALAKALPEALPMQDSSSFSQSDRLVQYSDSDSDRLDQHSENLGEHRGRGGERVPRSPAAPRPCGPGAQRAGPERPETVENGRGEAKNGRARVREGPEGAETADKPRARAPTGEGPPCAAGDGGIPDPAALTVRQIRRLELDDGGWEVLRAREEAGKRRASALAHIDRMLNRAPPAVLIYQRLAQYWPNRELWDDIGRAVGDDPRDLEFWEQVVKAYVLCGWNKLNIMTMLEFYGRREVPPGKRILAARLPAEPKSALEDYEDWLREEREAGGDPW
jgi:hypothetical protein